MFNSASRAGLARTGVAVAVTAALFSGFAFAIGAGQQPEKPAGGPADFAGMLIKGLEETEGCLGVDAAQFRSGKNTIVAWFENKEAAVRWYNSPVHRRMLMGTGGVPIDREPLAHVTDPDAPIMVMASISMGGKPAIPNSPMPFSQISIELYAPLPGGASINGRLAPEAFRVPHHRAIGG
jgi:hypothetical protein